MKAKILNLPNLISLFRLIVLIPLIVYFFAIHENLIALLIGLFSLFMDGVDGFIARKTNQVTEFGTHLDPWIDNILLASLIVSFMIWQYITWPIFALIAAHRLTRLFLTLFLSFNYNGYYIPRKMKLTAFVPFLWFLFIPLSIEYTGIEITNTATFAIILFSYFVLLFMTFSAIKQARQKSLPLTKFRH